MHVERNKKFRLKSARLLWGVSLLVVGALIIFACYRLQEQREPDGPPRSSSPHLPESNNVVETPSGSADGSARVPASSPIAKASVETAEGLVFSAATAAEGLRLAQERFGPNSFAVNRAAQVVRSLCGRSIDPSGSLNHNTPDPTRDWVIERIVDYCADWTPEVFAPTASSDSPTNIHQVLREKGEGAAIEVAQSHIARNNDAATLHEAALWLFERGEIPSPTSLSAGPADAVAALGHSARLVACDASASCGPYSPVTLGFCRIHGCAPGVTLIDALRENMSATDFSLVLWYYQWMNAQRGRSG